LGYWEEYLGEYNPREPPFTIIIGDINTGKTATLASISDEYHTNYKLPAYLIATRNELKHFPDWWTRVDPKNIKVPKDAIFNGDDLHKYYHARDWADGKVRDLETLARERGHTGTMMNVTTQVSRVIDVNLLNIASALIIKKPSLMMAKYDRAEIAPIIRKADKALEEGEPEKAYIVSNVARYEGVIDNIPLPSWWTDETSTLHRDNPGPQRSRNLNSVGGVLKAIGRTFK